MEAFLMVVLMAFAALVAAIIVAVGWVVITVSIWIVSVIWDVCFS